MTIIEATLAEDNNTKLFCACYELFLGGRGIKSNKIKLCLRWNPTFMMIRTKSPLQADWKFACKPNCYDNL